MISIRDKRGFICDMDGVIYHGNLLLDGAKEFVEWLHANDKRFLFLTNSSQRSPRELQEKLARMGLYVTEDHFYTSALATASFLASQKPNGTAYVIGEAGLVKALYDVGFSMNDVNPDYVVVGETTNYNYNLMEKAVHFVSKWAKLVVTNPDLTGPTETGIAPACRALIAPIELATFREAYFVGKPNPLMMRQAQKRLECEASETVIIGDRMDTDIIAGIESEIETVLVLSGVSNENTPKLFPYRPDHVLSSVGAIPNSSN